MTISWPLYLLLIVFGGPLLRIFGASYSAGTSVLVLLALSMLVATGCGVVDVVLAMAGHTSWNLGNAVLALAVNIGLDVWLIPAHGVLGAAIGWAVAIVVRNLAALIQVGVSARPAPDRTGHPVGRRVEHRLLPRHPGWSTAAARLDVVGPRVGAPGRRRLYLVALWHFRRDLKLDALLHR